MNSGTSNTSFVNKTLMTVYRCYAFSGLVAYRYSNEDGIVVSPKTFFKLIVLCAMYSALIYYDSYIGASSSVAGENSALFNSGIKLLITSSLSFSMGTVLFGYFGRSQFALLLKDYEAVEHKVWLRFDKRWAPISFDELRFLHLQLNEAKIPVNIDKNVQRFYLLMVCCYGMVALIFVQFVHYLRFYAEMDYQKQLIFLFANTQQCLTYTANASMFNMNYGDIYTKYRALNDFFR